MAKIAMMGRDGPFPYAGFFYGALGGGEMTRVSWVGQVTSGSSLELAWSASRTVQNALMSGGPIDADRRRALSILWARLDGIDRSALGPNGGDGLVLCLLCHDADGLALSSVGLDGLYFSEFGEALQTWVRDPHPALGFAGLPKKRPGALVLHGGPEWVFAVPQGRGVILSGQSLASAMERCGVTQ